MTTDKQEQALMVEVAKHIPNNADGAFLRQLIFDNWIMLDKVGIKWLLKRHFPEKELS